MSVQIIAELAQGYEGRPEQARLLLSSAARAGADAAKFQLVYADELATPDYKYYPLFESLEMDDSVWCELAVDAKRLGIELEVDIFGKRGLHLAERAGIGVVKLHGTDIANTALLEDVALSSVSKVLLGAGGAYFNEIKHALGKLSGKEVVLFLGFQGYPTPNDSNQIARISLLKQYAHKKFPRVQIGFADHAPSGDALRHALAATAIGAGATVLEKHLTLAKVMELEDFESALNPDEFAEFCFIARNCSEAMGVVEDRDQFGMSESEEKYRAMIRRHVVVDRDISAGTRLNPADLVLKRAGGEDILTDLKLAYGRTIKRDMRRNSPISLRDLE